VNDLDFDQTIRGFAVGQKVFDRYTVKKVLGRGGMGVVWLAFDEKLERDVALKFLPELLVLDAASLDDLKRETKRNLDLTHQHIVRVYDFAQDGHCAGISMEYVDGPTLSALRVERENKVLECEDLESIVPQACAALEYAHVAAGIVHRDLKPANLMMNSRGQVKITDFGIARSLSDSISMLTMKKTSGTLVYMSPQQLDGDHASPLDDIYSLGATIYELLTSKPPFYSGGIDKQIHEKTPPSVAQRRQELDIVSDKTIPAHWEETIAACLSKNPADRPKTAREVAERLTLTPLPGTVPVRLPSAPTEKKVVPIQVGSQQTQTAVARHERRFAAVRWLPVAAVALVALIIAFNFGKLMRLTGLSKSAPTAQWARFVSEQQLEANFTKGRPLRFGFNQITVQPQNSELADIDVTGDATTMEPLYENTSPDDSALRARMANLQATEQKVATLQESAGVNIAPVNLNEFVFVRETTPAGKSAPFHLRFQAEHVGSQWQVKKVTAAELSPPDSFPGKPIAGFGGNSLIVGTEKARSAVADLSHRIDEYIERIAAAQKGARKRLALAGRDAEGNLLFPADHGVPGERFPDTRMRVLTANELQQLSDDKLQYAINEVYARHGAAFDEKISSLFKNFSWYQPQADVTPQEVEASFSSIETQNVKMLGTVRTAKQEQSSQQRAASSQQRSSRQRDQDSQQQPGSAMQKAKDAADIFSKVRSFMPGRP
jgi:serine/threonine protein kinase